MKMLIGALALIVAAQGAAIAQTSPAPNTAIQMHGNVITLVPAGKKSPAGSATLAQQNGGGLIVALSLPQGYQPARAAIVSGTCENNTAASLSPDEPVALNVNATGGSANTTLPDVTLNDLTSKPHVVIVLGTPALCGDIKP